MVLDPAPMLESAVIQSLDDDRLSMLLRIDVREIIRPEQWAEYGRQCDAHGLNYSIKIDS